MSSRSPVDFIFGVHFHQPAGNFSEVLEKAYQDAYRPFIDSFKKFKSLKLNLHISSPLLEYFDREHPEFLDTLALLSSRGRIEVLGGGFYEPVITSIPPRDLEGQLDKMKNFLKRRLGITARGIWLTERVWEPHIPSLLKKSNVEYLAVDDTHFLQAGFLPSQLKDYYLTEDNGNRLGIFIIDKSLRYHIPFKKPEQVIDRFTHFSLKYKNPLLCMLDDGEKFGLWPGTKKWLNETNWLELFFKALEDNSSWLTTRRMGEYFDSRPPRGLAYLPSAQYYEMREWAMPVEGALKLEKVKEKLKDKNLLDQTQQFISGGIWKNYFFKYPESNYAHKKMVYISSKLQKHGKAVLKAGLLNEARESLYRSQCNCAYWHGVFGGIYLPHLRKSIHLNLNRVLTIIDKSVYGDSFIKHRVFDIDFDSKDELVINSDSLFISLSPSKGGIIEDLSDKTTLINHLDTVARRKEAYHRAILDDGAGGGAVDESDSGKSKEADSIHDIKSADLKKYFTYLNFDSYMRKSLVDHIFPPDTSIEDFITQSGRAKKVSLPSLSLKVKSREDSIKARMEGKLNKKIKIIKSLEVEKGRREFRACIKLLNSSKSPCSFLYGLEFNFNLFSECSEDKGYLIGEDTAPLNKRGQSKKALSFGVFDREQSYRALITLGRESDLWYYPVRVVASSEGGFELSYQSSCIMPLFKVSLKEKEEFNISLNYSVSDLKD